MQCDEGRRDASKSSHKSPALQELTLRLEVELRTACQDKSVEMCRKQMQMRLELDEEHRQTRRLQRFRTPRDERMQETLLRHKSYAFALAANDGAPPG